MIDKLPIRQIPPRDLQRDGTIRRTVRDINVIIALAAQSEPLPILVDDGDRRSVLLGHGRLAAAIERKDRLVAMVGYWDISREQRKQLVLAERKFAAALSNQETLQQELARLLRDEPELDSAINGPLDGVGSAQNSSLVSGGVAAGQAGLTRASHVGRTAWQPDRSSAQLPAISLSQCTPVRDQAFMQAFASVPIRRVPVDWFIDDPNVACLAQDRNKVMQVIRVFGPLPILIADDGEVLLGRDRLAVAIFAGATEVLAIRFADLDEPQARAVVASERKYSQLVYGLKSVRGVEFKALLAIAPQLQSALEQPDDIALLTQLSGELTTIESGKKASDLDEAEAEDASDDAADGDYEVGYGNPPRHTQFQKGQSGNPGGRPKKLVRDIALDVAFELVPFTMPDGRIVEIPALQAVLLSQQALALSGSGVSQRSYLKTMQMFQAEQLADERREEKRRRKREAREREQAEQTISDIELGRRLINTLERANAAAVNEADGPIAGERDVAKLMSGTSALPLATTASAAPTPEQLTELMDVADAPPLGGEDVAMSGGEGPSPGIEDAAAPPSEDANHGDGSAAASAKAKLAHAAAEQDGTGSGEPEAALAADAVTGVADPPAAAAPMSQRPERGGCVAAPHS